MVPKSYPLGTQSNRLNCTFSSVKNDSYMQTKPELFWTKYNNYSCCIFVCGLKYGKQMWYAQDLHYFLYVSSIFAPSENEWIWVLSQNYKNIKAYKKYNSTAETEHRNIYNWVDHSKRSIQELIYFYNNCYILICFKKNILVSTLTNWESCQVSS